MFDLGLLSPNERVKESTIRLKQALHKQLRHKSNAPLIEMFNHCWNTLVDEYKDKEYKLAIS